jgi:eukaryotic-like serine/threonine-protein kinase
MKTSNHFNQQQLMQLISGSVSDQNLEEMERHVEQCTVCQRRLDTIAGDSNWWSKASEFLSDEEILRTRDIALHDPVQWEADCESSPGNIREYLDTPVHPEMLGRLDQFDVERVVGRGGMGVVLKAFDRELNRPVALKLLAPHLAVNGTARKRFAREARAAAAIVHPNVVAIHGVKSTGKLPYLVMPYVGGQSLQAYVDDHGPLEEKDIVRIAKQIAAGLGAAHQQGLVHRDIKPANILIESDVSRVQITDFGLARTTDDVSMTQTGWLAGTPNYMSPEQATGKSIGQRSDLFSLGSVMYFMATGRVPFRSDSPMGVLHRINNEQPMPVRQVNSDISKTLASIIEKLHEKEPNHRFQDASELHDVLERFLAYLHQPEAMTAPPKIVSYRSRQQRKRLTWGFAGALGLLIGCLAGWWAVNTFARNNNTPGDHPSEIAATSDSMNSIAAQYQLISDDQYINQFRQIQMELETLQSLQQANSFYTSDDLIASEINAIDYTVNKIDIHWRLVDLLQGEARHGSGIEPLPNR